MKTSTAFFIGLTFAAAAALPAYAGSWRQNASGWWYQNDDGTYPAGGWLQKEQADSNGKIGDCPHREKAKQEYPFP